MTITVTESELLTELRASVESNAPPDAMTTAELAAELDVSGTTVKSMLAKLRAAGRLETYRLRRIDATGRTVNVPAYVLKPVAPANADQRFKQDRKPSRKRSA